MEDNKKDFEEEYEKLRKKVELRDEMGGALYWNVLNEECCHLANEISAKGGDKKTISKILGEGTHQVN